jgi:hypothetical protein
MRFKLALLFSIISLAAYAPLSHAQTRPVLQQRSDCVVFGTLTDTSDVMGNLFAAMIAYQKMMNKEARDERKLATADAKLELTLKAGKLAAENDRIAQEKKEAQEKADTAMAAANVSLATGITSAALQIVASPVVSKGSTNVQDLQRFTATAAGLKSDIAKLNTEIRRNDTLAKQGRAGTLSAADVERMKGPIEKGLQEIQKARTSVKAC